MISKVLVLLVFGLIAFTNSARALNLGDCARAFSILPPHLMGDSKAVYHFDGLPPEGVVPLSWIENEVRINQSLALTRGVLSTKRSPKLQNDGIRYVSFEGHTVDLKTLQNIRARSVDLKSSVQIVLNLMLGTLSVEGLAAMSYIFKKSEGFHWDSSSDPLLHSLISNFILPLRETTEQMQSLVTNLQNGTGYDYIFSDLWSSALVAGYKPLPLISKKMATSEFYGMIKGDSQYDAQSRKELFGTTEILQPYKILFEKNVNPAPLDPNIRDNRGKFIKLGLGSFVTYALDKPDRSPLAHNFVVLSSPKEIQSTYRQVFNTTASPPL